VTLYSTQAPEQAGVLAISSTPMSEWRSHDSIWHDDSAVIAASSTR